MDVSKAIERLNIMLDMREKRGYYAETDALQLGILALKQILQIRAYAKDLFLPKLPGEIKE